MSSAFESGEVERWKWNPRVGDQPSKRQITESDSSCQEKILLGYKVK